MNENLEKLLFERYPKMFDNHNSREPFPMFGVECGNGWFDLLDSLCSHIQAKIDRTQRQNELDCRYNQMLEHLRDGRYDLFDDWTRGWSSAQIEQFRNQLDVAKGRVVTEVIPQVVVEQIKEKFGTLRFYFRGGNEKIYDLVEFAETLSGKICETCGNPGHSRGSRWVYTACDQHTKFKDKLDNNEKSIDK